MGGPPFALPMKNTVRIYDYGRQAAAMEETMRHFSIIALTAAMIGLLTLTPAAAQNKFENKDTAKNRQDNTFGTKSKADDKAVTTFGTNEAGDTTIDSDRPKQTEEDWYDKIIITADPITTWPEKGKTSTTTTEETYDSATDSTVTKSTTTETSRE